MQAFIDQKISSFGVYSRFNERIGRHRLTARRDQLDAEVGQALRASPARVRRDPKTAKLELSAIKLAGDRPPSRARHPASTPLRGIDLGAGRSAIGRRIKTRDLRHNLSPISE